MTIAACYLTTEGVAFAADSTTTVGVVDGLRHYNFAQKIFEIGQPSTLGIVTWGLGGFPARSHRTLIAEFADKLRNGQQLDSVQDIAGKWVEHFWPAYATDCAAPIACAKSLDAKGKPNRTKDEEDGYQGLLQTFSGGFCIGGNLLHARTPAAVEFMFGPLDTSPRALVPLSVGEMKLYGCPNILLRLVKGADPEFLQRLAASPFWKGSQTDLDALLNPSMLQPVTLLPLREAIDYAHWAVYTTIKMMKFSQLAPVCGGPVEVAVITSDRHFRWVRHKTLGVAVESSGAAW